MYNQKRRLPFHIFRSQKQRIKPNGEGTQSKAIYHRNRSMVSTNAVGYIDTVIKDGWGTLLLNQINGRLQFDLFSYYQHCTFCIFQIGTQVSKQFLFCSHFLMFEFRFPPSLHIYLLLFEGANSSFAQQTTCSINREIPPLNL